MHSSADSDRFDNTQIERGRSGRILPSVSRVRVAPCGILHQAGARLQGLPARRRILALGNTGIEVEFDFTLSSGSNSHPSRFRDGFPVANDFCLKRVVVLLPVKERWGNQSATIGLRRCRLIVDSKFCLSRQSHHQRGTSIGVGNIAAIVVANGGIAAVNVAAIPTVAAIATVASPATTAAIATGASPATTAAVATGAPTPVATGAPAAITAVAPSAASASMRDVAMSCVRTDDRRRLHIDARCCSWVAQSHHEHETVHNEYLLHTKVHADSDVKWIAFGPLELKLVLTLRDMDKLRVVKCTGRICRLQGLRRAALRHAPRGRERGCDSILSLSAKEKGEPEGPPSDRILDRRSSNPRIEP